MSVSAKVDLSTVPRLSDEPIRKIPQYVFENCNQYTCNSYIAGLLSHLKEKASEITNFGHHGQAVQAHDNCGIHHRKKKYIEMLRFHIFYIREGPSTRQGIFARNH